MNETTYNVISNIFFSHIDKWILIGIIISTIILGLILSRNSTMNFLKSLANKFFIAITITFIIYISIILLILNYTPFYDIFKLSDIFGLILFDLFLCIFESYKLSYENQYTFNILNKLLKSSIFVYGLDICRMIIKPEKIEIWNLLYKICGDMALIIIIGAIIFPFMYFTAVMNEYYQIYSINKINNLNIDTSTVFSKNRFNLKKIFEYRIKIETYETNSTEPLDSELFELKDNNIYKMGEKVGNYTFLNEMPQFNPNKTSYAETKYNKFSYMINFDEGKDDTNYIYIPINNLIVKLCLKSKTEPLRYQSDLVEFIYKNKEILNKSGAKLWKA